MNDGHPDDHLVARTLEGDTEAFGLLVDRYRRGVHGLIRQVVGDRDVASDLAQDAFIRAYTALSTYTARGFFRAWLYRIALNLARDEVRRSTRRKVIYLDEVRGVAANGETQVTVQERAETALAVRRTLARLTPDERLILTLRDLDGLAYEEVAEVLGIPLGTVKSRTHRARMAFKEAFRRAEGRQMGEGAV